MNTTLVRIPSTPFRLPSINIIDNLDDVENKNITPFKCPAERVEIGLKNLENYMNYIYGRLEVLNQYLESRSQRKLT